jgi:type II secretory pathway predicted ATPase ExeA
MLPEYLRHWGFTKNPFSLSPDPSMLFLGPHHHEALLRLKYGVMSNKGGVLLVSENAGDGKTSLLRRLSDDLTREYDGNIKIAFIDHPTLTVNQMVAEIARLLGVPRVRKEKIDNLNALRVKLLSMHEAGVKSLVIVDEGQMLAHKPDILQELRILLNFCVADSFLLSFVFSGQKPLEAALKQMPEFWQRLPVRFFLRNLDLPNTAELVRHRVRTAGQTEREVFTPTALEGIHRFSQGCPRVICAIADLALLVGHSLRSQKVDFIEVSQAVTDMTRSGDAFHYFSFKREEADSKPRARRAQCPACRRFVRKDAAVCGRCGATLPAVPGPASASAPALPVAVAGERAHCPNCLGVPGNGPRCAGCGFVVAQHCPRCQHKNPAEKGACQRCGQGLAGRDRLAARQLEEGLRRLGVGPPPPKVLGRFPVLQSEGRVYLGSVASRFFWAPKPQLHTAHDTLEGSFFVTERALIFANGTSTRRIPYPEIRNLSITTNDDGARRVTQRMKIVLGTEELRLAFPMQTDKPVQLASLLSDFVTNKRFLASG